MDKSGGLDERGGSRAALAVAVALAVSLAAPERVAACTLAVTGTDTVNAGDTFTLNLSASGGTPTSWTISWGDGAIETFAGNPASVTHTYVGGTPSFFTYNVLASAVCGGTTYFQNDLVVPSAANDRLNWYAHDGPTNSAVTRAPTQSGPDAGLDYPLDAIIGPDGNLYVSGLSSGNVVRYDPATGAFIDEFATGGTAASGMAFGPDGHLYVGDATLRTVRRYHGGTGAFIDDFVTAGSGGIVEPEGLTFGPDGHLYVSDFRNDTVYRYDGSTGAFIDVFITGTAPRDAEDIVFGPDGNLYVASDRDHKVLRYDGTTGAYIDDFVTAGSGGMENAQGVAFGPDGNFYVSSFKDDNVVRYDGTTGVFIDVYVSAGLGGLDTAEYFDFIPGHQVMVVAVTAVELVSFTAAGVDGGVELSWETGSELDNLGFHLYRSVSDEGPYERITPSLIPGLGSTPEGARYHYRDTGLDHGVTYFYELEDVETTGRTERHGPVHAAATLGHVVEDDPEPRADRGSASVITYGDPESNRLSVVNRGRHQVVLELTTAGFLAYPEADGTVRIEIAGYQEVDESGLPVNRTWVEAVAGRRVELVSVRERDVEAVALRPRGASEHEVVASGRGVVELRRRARASVRRGGPSNAARLVDVAFQGEVKKALVEMAPLSWEASRQRMRLAKRLVVTLSFAKRDRDELVGPDGARGRRAPGKNERFARRGVVARLATTSPGLHAVRYEEIFGTSYRRGLDPARLRLSRLGEPSAFHLEPSAGRFAPGSTLYFVSPGADANPYGDEAVFELAHGVPGGVTMPVRDAAPAGAATSSYRQRDEYEENHLYQAALLSARERWFWDVLFAPARKAFAFSLDDLAPAVEPSRLELRLSGGSDLPRSPDHHVVVYVNGTLVAERSWNGKLPQELDAELSPGLLREGENVLEVVNVGDTGAAYSMVFVDRYAVTYRRLANAEGGLLAGRWMEPGTAEISGMSPGAPVVETTGDHPAWLAGAALSEDGVLRFRAQAEHDYLVVDPGRVAHPEIRRASGARLTRGSHRADYIAIGPRAFLDAARPLLDRRRRQGLTVLGVPIEEVYAEFGFGERRPEAIRDFLTYAYHHWSDPSPRYVLLLGDATYDFKNYYGTNVENRVPPLMLETRFLWTASDPTYGAVNGDDLLPDLAIGRLPAASVDEVRIMVGKILAYETSDASLGAPIVLVSDDPDEAGDFDADAKSLAATVLADRVVEHISLKALGTAASRRAILDAFDGGASVVSYMGHGGIHLWANENLLDVTSAGALSPQSQQPLLLTMNCLNGYFHFPYFNSLSEELVKAEGKGAIAAFSPSGMSLNGPANEYHRALLDELLHGSHTRLGDAVLAAQEAYAETGALPELLSIYHLLGDPGLTLR